MVFCLFFVGNVYATGLNQPRFITFGPDGALYVADRANNRIVYLPDANGDGVADATKVFADNIPTPHSVVYHDGAWYVGVSSGVIELKDTNGDGVADQERRRRGLLAELDGEGPGALQGLEIEPRGAAGAAREELGPDATAGLGEERALVVPELGHHARQRRARDDVDARATLR